MTSQFRPTSLRCEYRENPLGIDRIHPRFCWNLESSERDCRQSAYQILVAGSRRLLDEDRGDFWDSGKIESDRSLHVPYAGYSLRSSRQMFWKVRVWDRDHASDWSDPATFITGLLDLQDWIACWITPDPATYGSQSLPILRRTFTLDQPIERALVFICGLGQFELHVNGNRVGRNVLDPGWTNYTKTCLYVTHDVTEFLRRGENVLGVMLGNGMYNVIGSPGRYKKFKATFGQPKLIAQLQLESSNGLAGIIGTDASWRISPGPITFCCIYGGEDYDARLEQPGWDSPGFDDGKWLTPIVTTGPGGTLASQSAPPIQVGRTFTGVKTAANPAVYDLGRNFSGRPKIATRGASGETVKLVTGELLDSEGRVSQKSSGSPVYFSFTSNGKEKTWHPRFSYSGFRYVEVQQNQASIESLSGEFVHSSAAVVGKFSCSSPLFNSIHELINAAILSNLQSVLTDCPHREKLGWLEQTHLMGQAVMFNYDVPLLYTKICADMRESQRHDGCIPTLAPEYTVFKDQWADFSNSPEWGSAAIINPWLVYQQYGDVEILRENYDMMRRYAEYLQTREQDGILNFGLGDWYDLGPGDPGYAKLTSKSLTATGIYYLDMKILQKVARLLGCRHDAEEFGIRTGRIRRTFNSTFFHADTGRYDTGSQTAQAMPLALGMVDAAHREKVLENLVADIRAKNNHITAGDVGFRFVLDALAEAGRSDVIGDLLSRTDPPSYGAQLQQGATTLTEAWDANPTKSQNHLMLGHAEIWFYQTLAGIRVDFSNPAPLQIIIQPTPIPQISWAKAEYRSVVGPITSEWRRENRKLTLSIEIPANIAATVRMPGRDAFEIGSGSHQFESELSVSFN